MVGDIHYQIHGFPKYVMETVIIPCGKIVFIKRAAQRLAAATSSGKSMVQKIVHQVLPPTDDAFGWPTLIPISHYAFAESSTAKH